MKSVSNPELNSNWTPLIEIARGTLHGQPCVEIEHLGAVAVVDSEGRVLYSVGNVERPVHLRSTAKPFQLLPFMLEGLDAGLEAADLALLMSSHSGEPAHLERLRWLLTHFDLSESALLCGTHAPYHDKSRRALVAQGISPCVLHNNCSGKHLAMLAVCKKRGWSLETYLQPDHPLQQWIQDLLLSLSGIDEAELGVGIDGCSLPTYVMPLRSIAQLYARLSFQPADVELSVAQALSKLFKAGVQHPEMLAGAGRLEGTLVESVGPTLFAKTGADGVFAMAHAPNDSFLQGVGIVIKVADGDSSQVARPRVAAEALRQMGLLPQVPPGLGAPILKNLRGLEVALARTVFRLV